MDTGYYAGDYGVMGRVKEVTFFLPQNCVGKLVIETPSMSSLQINNKPRELPQGLFFCKTHSGV